MAGRRRRVSTFPVGLEAAEALPVKRKPLPSQDYLRECFTYDEATGELRWKKRPRGHFDTKRVWRLWNTRFAGKVAGYVQGQKRAVLLDYQHYLVHRVIWRMMTGEDPGDLEIDHENSDGVDNRWRNLRRATHSQNGAGRKVHRDNELGVKGVARRGNKFEAQIWFEGRNIHLGKYDRVKEAKAIYDAMAVRLYGEFARP